MHLQNVWIIQLAVLPFVAVLHPKWSVVDLFSTFAENYVSGLCWPSVCPACLHIICSQLAYFLFCDKDWSDSLRYGLRLGAMVKCTQSSVLISSVVVWAAMKRWDFFVKELLAWFYVDLPALIRPLPWAPAAVQPFRPFKIRHRHLQRPRDGELWPLRPLIMPSVMCGLRFQENRHMYVWKNKY